MLLTSILSIIVYILLSYLCTEVLNSFAACRYVDTMNNKHSPDSSAGAFLTAVLDVQNKRWPQAKGMWYNLIPGTAAQVCYVGGVNLMHLWVFTDTFYEPSYWHLTTWYCCTSSAKIAVIVKQVLTLQ